jgi:hypothetical protein
MASDRDIVREETAIYLGLVLAGGLPCVGWLVRGGAAGAGITLCIAMIALGLVGLLGLVVRPTPSLPRARVRR